MLKDYFTKGLQFLQMSGKSSHSAEKQDDESIRRVQPEDMPIAETRETSSHFESAPVDSMDGGNPFAEPVPPDHPLGQEDYEAGLLAYQEKRTEEALAALLRAADAGHMEAQFLCGHLYQHGIATAENCRVALGWYKRSARQGFLRAQMACAVMYEEGLGTEIDLKRALSWYEQAAKQGDVSAQLKCGRMYHSGRAETRNPKKARYWLEIAAENGSEEASQLLEDRF